MEKDASVLVPEKYAVLMQDMSKGYLDLKLMGTVNTLSEAQTVVKAFYDSDDRNNERGYRAYFIICQGGNVNA